VQLLKPCWVLLFLQTRSFHLRFIQQNRSLSFSYITTPAIPFFVFYLLVYTKIVWPHILLRKLQLFLESVFSRYTFWFYHLHTPMAQFYLFVEKSQLLLRFSSDFCIKKSRRDIDSTVFVIRMMYSNTTWKRYASAFGKMLYFAPQILRRRRSRFVESQNMPLCEMEQAAHTYHLLIASSRFNVCRVASLTTNLVLTTGSSCKLKH